MTRVPRIQWRLRKAIMLYRKHHPDCPIDFYDLPVVLRRDFHRRANRVYNHRNQPRRRTA